MKSPRQCSWILKQIFLLAFYFLVSGASSRIPSSLSLFALQQRTIAPNGTVVLRAGNVASSPGGLRLESPTLSIDASLEAKIEEIVNGRPQDLADWGIEVLSLDDNQIIYAHNPHQPMVPASNMKLFTTATAMHYLGPNYRFKTAVYGRPEPQADGILQGSLVVRGGGDPFFAKTFLTENVLSFFDEIAQQLRGQGIRQISGNIIGDDSLYPYTPPPTSALSAGSLEVREERSAGGSDIDAEVDIGASGVSALSFNDDLVAIKVVPVRAGRPVQVYTEPRTDYFRMINRAVATTGRRNTFRLKRINGTNTIMLTGKLPLRRKGFYKYIRVDDPASFVAYLLKESMERHGIVVSGIPQSHHEGRIPYREMRELARHESPPLIEAISIINKQSINAHAELLLRLIGMEVRGSDTAEAGISVVQDYVAQTGINPKDLAIYDGSGLSRSNALSPHAEILLLRYVTLQNYYPHFVSSLAVAGVDGTLRRRLSNGATVQRVFGKTGTLGNVVALGGFMYSLHGKRLAFSIFCNNFARGAGSARHAVDQIMEVLAQHEYQKSESVVVDSNSLQHEPADPFQALISCCSLAR